MQDTASFDPLTAVRTFILTIDKPEGARRQNADLQLQRLGLPYKFVEGVKADNARFPEYAPVLNKLLQKRNLSLGEVACYVGHRKIWLEFLQDKDAAFALIFEDDFEALDPSRLVSAVRDCIGHPNEWDLVKFFDYAPKPVVLQKDIGRTKVVAHKYVAAGMVGYLINRGAAMRLLRRQKIFRPVDEDIAHMWEFGIDVWSVCPNLVREISHTLGGSHLYAERERVRSRRNRVKSAAFMFVQAWRQMRSRQHLRRMRAKR